MIILSGIWKNNTSRMNLNAIKYQRILLTIGLCISISHSGIANRELSFKRLSTDEGLSHNSVYSIFEDKYGYIWIGTRNGLNRYNGSGFKTYLNHEKGFSGDIVNFIQEDSDGDLWVGTKDGGLNLYNWEKDNFLLYLPEDILSNPDKILNIEAILEISPGKILVGTNGNGLFILDKRGHNISPVNGSIHEEYLSRITRIKCLQIGKDSIIWVGTMDGLYGLKLYNGELSFYKTNIPAEITNEQILTLYFDGKSWLWAGTTHGLFKMNLDDLDLVKYCEQSGHLYFDVIRDLAAWDDSTLLLASDGGGLIYFNTRSEEKILYKHDPNDPRSLSNNAVYDIFIDSRSNLWIGNYAGGINFYSKYETKFRTIKHEINNIFSLTDNNVRSVYQDRKNRIWLGTFNGLNRYNPELNTIENFHSPGFPNLRSKVILSIQSVDEEILWVGTFSDGIYIVDLRKNRVSKYSNELDTNQSLNKSDVYDIELSDGGNLWIGTMGGLYQINERTGYLQRYTIHNSGISNNNIKALLYSSDGILWIGTNNGLSRFDPDDNTFTTYYQSANCNECLSNNRIIALFEDSEKRIWIGTEGGGLNVFNKTTEDFKYYNIQNGLPDNIINSIEEDQQGFIWIGTNKGLAKLNPESSEVIVYTRLDGLQGNEFYQQSCICTVDGHILTGGPGGFNYFHPLEIMKNPVVPKVVFTELYLYNQPVTIGEERSPLKKQFCLTETIDLKHNLSSISIHFSALGYVNSSSYLYAYYLEGMESDWNPFSIQKYASYTNLDPGEYHFKVKAINNDGLASENIAVLNIRVIPPPWGSWWAFVIYAVVFVLLLLMFRKYTIAWVHVKNELDFERKEKAQIEDLNQLKIRFFTNVSHEFKSPLTLIINHLNKLKEEITGPYRLRLVREIEKNSRRLLYLINELMDFRKAENNQVRLCVSRDNIIPFVREIKECFNVLADQRNISYSFEAETDSVYLWFDPNKLDKVIYNLLDNAFKFTEEGGLIRIGIITSGNRPSISNDRRDEHVKNVEKPCVEIFIEDNGLGISPENLDAVFERFYQVNNTIEDLFVKGYGIGLAYSKKLIDLHHGELRVESSPGVGSKFTIRLFQGKEHFDVKSQVEFQKKSDKPRLAGTDYALGNPLINRSVVKSPLFISESLPLLLIAEDDTSERDFLFSELVEKFRIIEAGNGKDALNMALDQIPDLIISDLRMPVMDGITFCGVVKSRNETCHIPIILLTGYGEDEDRIKGLVTGADAYITKPYNIKILTATIENLIENRKILHQKFRGIGSVIPDDIVTNKNDFKLMNKIITLIENNLASADMDVQQLCVEIGMSRSVLFRKIKALTGNSIQEFIRTIRLKKAAQLLADEDISINEVAYIVGFSNPKHFSTAFRKTFGKSPSGFRNSLI